MIHESLPFYRAIAADPDHDAPRLIYADWLEEQGAASRAEFIRLQCRRAAGDPHSQATRWMRSQEKALLHDLSPKWFGPEQGKLMRRRMSRGFIASTEVLSMHLADQADALFRFGPIERLNVVATSGSTRHEVKIVGLPNLACVVRLNLSDCHLQPDDIAELASSPYVYNLRQLDLSGNYVGNRGAEALYRSSQFDRLETLRVENCGIGDAMIRRLARAPDYPELRSVFAHMHSDGLTRFDRFPAELAE